MKRNFSSKAERQIRSDTKIEIHTFITGHDEHAVIAKVP